MEIASKRRVARVGAWAVVAFVTVGLASPAGAAAKKTTNEPVAVTGRGVSDAWMERLQRGGIAVLLLMMSIAMFNDISRLFG